MKTTLSKSNVKIPSLPKRRLGWGLGIQSGLESIAYKRNEKFENHDDQNSNSTAVTNLPAVQTNQSASYERHFSHNLYSLFCGIQIQRPRVQTWQIAQLFFKKISFNLFYKKLNTRQVTFSATFYTWESLPRAAAIKCYDIRQF